MSQFHAFAAQVHAQFNTMSAGELFTTNVDKDVLYAAYLAAFPEGTNPVFRVNTEHDCSCCRNFIKNIGGVVSIVNGELVTVWDSLDVQEPYATVAGILGAIVRGSSVTGIFRTKERIYGAETTKELHDDGVHTWHHFHGKIAAQHHADDAGTKIGDYNGAVQVFTRGLVELSAEAFTTVIDLIQSNSLYRGAEHLPALQGFQKLEREFSALAPVDARAAQNYIWANAFNPAARFRNTAIGSLIVDLSDGMDLEAAVRSFEQKVAPQNYKRPTALITPAMVKLAMATIDGLGLQPALERRFAKLSDISVNNVLWVDGRVAPQMKDGIEGVLLAAAAPAPTNIDTDKAEPITMADFVANVLPRATGMDLLIRNTQQSNFVSLTAPVHADAPPLFKWDNGFAWSYDGNITDSIKERVKRAGGQTNAVMRSSLAWFNYDDLDIHAIEPNDFEIFFMNRGQNSPGNAGMLDVDMNAGSGKTREAVENIVWQSPQDGVYKIQVNNYNKRESSDVGFTLEIENNGQVHQYSCATSPGYGKTVTALELTVKNRLITEIKTGSGITGGAFSQTKWGVPTEQLVKVNTLLRSPNHWDGNQTGNLHWFFVLDGCKNDLPARGIYNEFLAAGLEQHRKVFEVLGDKTKCAPMDDQLSGVGFSSTKGDSVLVRVTGAALRKTYNITF